MNREAPYSRHDFPVLREMQTRWSDNDVYGHMNNTVHYQLFDSILNIWLIENRLLDPRNSDVIGLVVNTGCSYFAELGYPAPVTAGLRTERIGHSAITYKMALFSEAPTAAAQGHLTHVLVERATRRPCPIPDNWIAALNTLQTPDADANSRAREENGRTHLQRNKTNKTQSSTEETTK